MPDLLWLLLVEASRHTTREDADFGRPPGWSAVARIGEGWSVLVVHSEHETPEAAKAAAAELVGETWTRSVERSAWLGLLEADDVGGPDA